MLHRHALTAYACRAVISLVLALPAMASLGDEIGPLRRDAQGNIVPAEPLPAPTPPAPAAQPKPPAAAKPPAVPPAAAAATPAPALGNAEATRIAVTHHDGQSFITWKDAAEGEDDSRYRYALYRSDKPITEQTLATAKLVEAGIVYNSAKLYGTDFAPQNRLDPSQPTATTHDGGAPLPQWSGLAVTTARKSGPAFYAVAVTDTALNRLGRIVPGANATTVAVEEQVAAPQPIEIAAADKRKEVPPASRCCARRARPWS